MRQHCGCIALTNNYAHNPVCSSLPHPSLPLLTLQPLFQPPLQACVDAGVEEAVDEAGKTAFVQKDRASLPLLMLGGERTGSKDAGGAAAAGASDDAGDAQPKGFLRYATVTSLHYCTIQIT